MNDRDWTCSEEGCANSSPLFLELVDRVAGTIRAGARALLHGQAEQVARTIMAQLAHEHGLAPYPSAHVAPGEKDWWFAYECLNAACSRSVVLDVRVSSEPDGQEPKVACPICAQPMRFSGRWAATREGYGSRADHAPLEGPVEVVKLARQDDLADLDRRLCELLKAARHDVETLRAAAPTDPFAGHHGERLDTSLRQLGAKWDQE